MGSATADETDLLNNGQGLVNAERVNGRLHSHGHNSVVHFQTPKFSKIEGDGMAKVVETNKRLSQVMTNESVRLKYLPSYV